MDTRPPLHLHLLAHPKSDDAREIAHQLMARFVEPPASGGLRVPVFFTPDRGDDKPPALAVRDGLRLDGAEHTIVVVLADARMARRVHDGTGEDWRAFIQQALAATPLGQSPHHILPVALDQDAFSLCEQQHMLPAMLDPALAEETVQQRRTAQLSLHIAARAIQLLEVGCIAETAPDRVQAPVRLFVSHAKADLAKDKTDPARLTMNAMNELPVESWFDAGKIATGQAFEKAILAGIQDCTVMLAFHTDQYGSRPWCRREVLEAKRLGAHLLLVDALRQGEARRFPYLGNVPTVRWQFGEAEVDARRVIDRAVLEALRFKHNRARLKAFATAGETILAAPPEALTLANVMPDPESAITLIYPDPPLGKEELDVLKKLRPGARFVTPLGKLAAQELPPRIKMMTVSISNSNDPERYGLSAAHQQTLSDEIHLYLLAAGLQIAYGGALSGDFSAASNFTLRLFELVRGYSNLTDLKVKIKPIENHPPWPLYLGYGDAEWNLFKDDADCKTGPRPDLPWSDDEIFPPAHEGWRFAPDTPERRYAWARGLSAMRQQITAASQVRLVIGGDLRRFQGIVPGVVEEAWLSVQRQQPLFLIGAFGGAARAVSDQLTGSDRVEFSDEDAAANVPDYRAAVQCYADHGGDFVSMQQMGDDFARLRAGGLSAALNNGLDDAENEELILCSEPERIAELVLTGLLRLA